MSKQTALPRMPKGWIDVALPVRDGRLRWPTGEKGEGPNATVGPARVIELAGGRAVTRAQLERRGIRAGERLLLRTTPRRQGLRSGRRRGILIERDAAEYLSARKVRAIGLDGPALRADSAARESLLHGGAWIAEGLDLSSVRAGRYELICVPLSIGQAGSAPARVMLRRRAG